jgi:pimeloyl-ACP methyl ester carboxylesterase
MSTNRVTHPPDLLTRSTSGQRIVAEGSGHYVHDEQPDLVITAIRKVFENRRP